jgi:hypothetical protein
MVLMIISFLTFLQPSIALMILLVSNVLFITHLLVRGNKSMKSMIFFATSIAMCLFLSSFISTAAIIGDKYFLKVLMGLAYVPPLLSYVGYRFDVKRGLKEGIHVYLIIGILIAGILLTLNENAEILDPFINKVSGGTIIDYIANETFAVVLLLPATALGLLGLLTLALTLMWEFKEILQGTS